MFFGKYHWIEWIESFVYLPLRANMLVVSIPKLLPQQKMQRYKLKKKSPETLTVFFDESRQFIATYHRRERSPQKVVL